MNFLCRCLFACLLCLTGTLVVRADEAALAKSIDRFVQARLSKDKIPASPKTDDAEFLRRIYLDLTGRIPTLEQTNTFLNSTEGDKRAKLIDELLARPEYGLHFGTQWRELIVDRTPEMSQLRQSFSWEFREWLADGFNKDRGWNDMVADMLIFEGEAKGNPAAVFLLSNRMNFFPRPADVISSAGRLFMGIQVRCAQCHDHPFVDQWKQDDFWGLAAFFGQVRDQAIKPGAGAPQNPTLNELPIPDSKANQVYNANLIRAGLLPPESGAKIGIPTVMDPAKTERVVKAKYFLEASPDLPSEGPYRTFFSEWLTSPKNPYFAKASVNRLWAHFFGRGIASIEDMRPGQAPSHPELLTLLESEYKKAGFKNKTLIRAICNSETYQRTSKPLKENVNDRELFSHMAIKQLTADQMIDALNIAVGRAVTLGKNREQMTTIFATAEADADPTEFSHGIPQYLFQMNNGVARNLREVVNRHSSNKNRPEAINTVYLTVLSRPARPAEIERMTKYVETAKDANQGFQDIFWALLNSAEFTLNR